MINYYVYRLIQLSHAALLLHAVQVFSALIPSILSPKPSVYLFDATDTAVCSSILRIYLVRSILLVRAHGSKRGQPFKVACLCRARVCLSTAGPKPCQSWGLDRSHARRVFSTITYTRAGGYRGVRSLCVCVYSGSLSKRLMGYPW